MYILKRFGLMFALMLVLAAGFGCGSKNADTGTVPPEDAGVSADELSAAEISEFVLKSIFLKSELPIIVAVE